MRRAEKLCRSLRRDDLPLFCAEQTAGVDVLRTFPIDMPTYAVGGESGLSDQRACLVDGTGIKTNSQLSIES